MRLLGEIVFRLRKWAVGWLTLTPHFLIGDPQRPYVRRWYVLPRNPLLNVYLHQFLRDDDDRALHDHPWPSVSLLLKGSYVEQRFLADFIDGYSGGRTMEETFKRTYRRGSVIFRRSTHTHRIELPDGRPAWTLFITGPVVREWGFHCPRGWVHFKEFTKPGATGEIGKGCEP